MLKCIRKAYLRWKYARTFLAFSYGLLRLVPIATPRQKAATIATRKAPTVAIIGTQAGIEATAAATVAPSISAPTIKIPEATPASAS